MSTSASSATSCFLNLSPSLIFFISLLAFSLSCFLHSCLLHCSTFVVSPCLLFSPPFSFLFYFLIIHHVPCRLPLGERLQLSRTKTINQSHVSFSPRLLLALHLLPLCQFYPLSFSSLFFASLHSFSSVCSIIYIIFCKVLLAHHL